MSSPYRVPAKPQAASTPKRLDTSLLWVGVIVWAGSMLRAIIGAMRHEPASQELALAFVLAIAIPWLARRARVARATTSRRQAGRLNG